MIIARNRIGLAALAIVVGSGPAFAQSANDLIGTYSFVHEVRDVGGRQSTVEAKGILVFDAGGKYTLTIIAPNVPNVASNNRMTATPDEAKAIVAATTAHFGSYSVAEGNLIFKIERASFLTGTALNRNGPSN